MTLDASKPSDATAFGYQLPGYQRETRQAVNDILAAIATLGAVATVADIELTAGQSLLVVGTDVVAIGLEVVFLSATGAETLTNITGGSNGQIKILIFEDDNITIEKDVTKFMLNSEGDFAGETDDILVLINRGGVAGASNGKWLELLRQVRID